MLVESSHERKRRGNRHQVASNRVRYREREKVPIVGSTNYLSLSHKTLLYPIKFCLLTSSQFGCFLQKLLQDLYLLLLMKYDDFWKEIEESSSLRKTLESCLECLSKKQYNTFKKLNKALPAKNKILHHWSALTKIILFIYHRIACQSQENQFSIIYNEWILDIPKMLNLIEIYKDTNREIVKDIVQSCLNKNKDYKNDFNNFLEILEDVVIPTLMDNIKFCTPKKKDNRDSVALEITMKALISFCDTFKNLINIYEIFPTEYKKRLAAHPQIHKKLLVCMDSFMKTVNDWTVENEELQGLLKTLMKDFIRFYELSFKELKEIIHGKSKSFSLMKYAIKTYELFCIQFRTSQIFQKQIIIPIFKRKIQIFCMNEDHIESFKNDFKFQEELLAKVSRKEKQLIEKFNDKNQKNQKKTIKINIPSFYQWKKSNQPIMEDVSGTNQNSSTKLSLIYDDEPDFQNSPFEAFLDDRGVFFETDFQTKGPI